MAKILNGLPGAVILGTIPERVEAVRFALDAYRSGIGAARLVRLMHEKGMVLSDWGIAAQQVYRLVRLPALRGQADLHRWRGLHVGGLLPSAIV